MKDRWRWGRRVLTAAGVVVLVATLAFLGWASDVSEAADEDLAAVRNDPDVEVVEHAGYLAFLPAGGRVTTEAIVFYPGAKIAPEAYVATWAPVVEATGTAVFLPAMPLNLAVLGVSRADDVRAAEPGVERWWVGGHSLGGAMAASYAGRTAPGALEGLVLWGAYATEGAGLRDREDLEVLSVSGGRDGLSTPAEVAAGAGFLPPGTVQVEIAGMNHAQFGRYGPQGGDGEPELTQAQAMAQLTEATARFLGSGR
jgi:hypothetical protein